MQTGQTTGEGAAPQREKGEEEAELILQVSPRFLQENQKIAALGVWCR